MSDDIFDDLFGFSAEREIVLVDDSEANLQLVSSVLTGMGGLSCKSFSSPTAALTYIQRNKPLLMLIDQVMPGPIKGLDLLMKVRESYDKFHLPIIMITGLEGDEVLERAFELGVNDFITKPLRRATLISRVRSQAEFALEIARLHDEIAQLNA